MHEGRPLLKQWAIFFRLWIQRGVVCAAEKIIRRRIVYVRQGNQQVGRQVPIPPFIAEILRLGAAKTCGKLSLREIMVLSKFPDSPRIGHEKLPPDTHSGILGMQKKEEGTWESVLPSWRPYWSLRRCLAAAAGRVRETALALRSTGETDSIGTPLQSPSREPLGADKKRRALGRPARAFSCGGNVKNFGSGKSRLQGGLPMVQYNVA